MESLYGPLSAVLAQYIDDEKVASAFVVAAWREVAGVGITERTHTAGFSKGKLTIAVHDALWQRNLEGLATQLLAQLNSRLTGITVKRIEIIVDPEMFAAKPRRI
ncbi:MAG: DUF721 domain-containing protein [Chloracidobacterium sp.]|nr:DUF721 domain-containing protein [Chloracidobacterium sp.]MCC6826100.1 DUF721 domain-containing protein [Acidobacteriota bacterium]MCO5334699.1 DUF721 domain-containing protein [Pyrinomonadaceae bacterium]